MTKAEQERKKRKKRENTKHMKAFMVNGKGRAMR